MKGYIKDFISILITYLILSLMDSFLFHKTAGNTFNLLVSFITYTVYKNNKGIK